jgi:hypothetical protein
MKASIKGIKKRIRKWWMLVTAPTGLVRIAGCYYVLGPSVSVPSAVAVPVKFNGVLGWYVDDTLPNRYFTNMKLAKQKTIEARFFIEFME